MQKVSLDLKKIENSQKKNSEICQFNMIKLRYILLESYWSMNGYIGMLNIQQLYCKADKLDAPVPVLHFQGNLNFPNSKMARRVVSTLYSTKF